MNERKNEKRKNERKSNNTVKRKKRRAVRINEWKEESYEVKKKIR